MKKLTLIIAIVFSGMLLMVSCKKTQVTASSEPELNLKKLDYISHLGGVLTKFVYNADGDLIEIDYPADYDPNRITIQDNRIYRIYQKDGTYAEWRYNGNSVEYVNSSDLTYPLLRGTLNNDGKPIKIEYLNPESDIKSFEYQYSNKNIISRTVNYADSMNVFTDFNYDGNINILHQVTLIFWDESTYSKNNWIIDDYIQYKYDDDGYVIQKIVNTADTLNYYYIAQ